jgi:serine/threonine protein kinase
MEDEEAGSLAYTMKLVQGRTFQQVLNEAREQVASKALIDDRSSIAQRVEMFLPVVDAMAYAHSKGAIHRDLKPENIMVGAHHEVLVMDWGIARRVTDKEELTDASEATVSMTTNREDGTQIGMAVGTPPT